MAIAPSLLTQGSKTTFDTSNAVTASISPGANRLVLLCLRYNGSVAPTITGNGLTWVLVAASNQYVLNSTCRLYRAMGASPSSGSVTISSTANFGCSWIVLEFSGTDTSGTNGSGAIVQSATNTTGAGVSLTVTLPSAFGNAANAAFGTFAADNTAAAFSPGGGFTEIAEQLGGAHRVQAEWRIGQDLTVDVTGNWNDGAGGVAIEIKEGTVNASAQLSGTATITANARSVVFASAALQATAQLSANARSLARVQAALVGTATLRLGFIAASAALTGTASIVAKAQARWRNAPRPVGSARVTKPLRPGSARHK